MASDTESAPERIVVPFPIGSHRGVLRLALAGRHRLDDPAQLRRPEPVVIPRRAGREPDELRVDLDPTPEASFAEVRAVAVVAREVFDENELERFPKTSSAKGLHIYVRIQPLWRFTAVRRAAIAIGREVESRMPRLATTAWWTEDRRGVFIQVMDSTG